MIDETLHSALRTFNVRRTVDQMATGYSFLRVCYLYNMFDSDPDEIYERLMNLVES